MTTLFDITGLVRRECVLSCRELVKSGLAIGSVRMRELGVWDRPWDKNNQGLATRPGIEMGQEHSTAHNTVRWES